MRVAYFECSSGISGDMCLGSLIHAGASLKEIRRKLAKLPVKGYTLIERKVSRKGFHATKVDLKINKKEHPKRWKDIAGIIQGSALQPDIKEKGLRIFKSLFIAEAIVHGEPYDRLHLHELGSVDTIIDIFGTLICLRELGIEKVYSSAVNLGGGTVTTSHGLLPVPVPAVAELLKGIPVYSTEVPHELTTPTGAAILKGLSSGFGDMPLMSPDKIGIGAGAHDLKDRPNILRVFIGNSHSSPERDILVIETNIDDMNPKIYEYLMEKLLKQGALDVFLTQIIMKKARPAVKLTVLCHEDKKQPLIDTILKETTTLGLRFYNAERVTLKRKIKTIDTEIGRIRLKEAYIDNRLIKAAPEYEDCKRAAKRHGIPLLEVMRRAGGRESA